MSAKFAFRTQSERKFHRLLIERKDYKMKNSKKGMEMVQVAILVAIAVGLGLLFKDHITTFIENTFLSLTQAKF